MRRPKEFVAIHAGGFETPTELYSFFFHAGCEPSDIKAFKGPDDLWRGSGISRHNIEAIAE